MDASTVGGDLRVSGFPTARTLVGAGAGLALALVAGRAAAWTHVAASSGASRLVVWSDQEVRRSDDDGATFRTVTLPAGEKVHSAAITDDGTVSGVALLFVDVSIDTCRSDDLIEWQRIVRFDAASAATASVATAPVAGQSVFDIERGAVVWDWAFGAFGWVYGVSNDGRAFAVSSSGASVIPELGTSTSASASAEVLQIAHDGRTTLAIRGTLLVSLSGPKPVVLDRASPVVTSLAVDAVGRALGIDASGAVVRFSRRGGGAWSTVLAP
jgi:hypothetical protein